MNAPGSRGVMKYAAPLVLLMELLVMTPAPSGAVFGARLQPPPSRILQVFVERDAVGQQDRLTLLDSSSGETRDLLVTGDRYTAARDRVIFWDQAQREVREVLADGRPRPVAWLEAEDTARRIDWIVAANSTTLAWTITSGTVDALHTRTFVGTVDGDAARLVFEDGDYEGVRAAPVAFNGDDTLYMDYQPDTIADFTPFRQYASLFALDLTSGETRTLPGEPGCFCGAGIGAGEFLRLTLPGGNFALRVVDLLMETGAVLGGERTLDAPFTGYDLSGDVMIAPDGAHAIYALARVRGFGTPDQSLETQFVLVDLISMTQRAFFPTTTRYLRPTAWTEDSSAVVFTSPVEAGTWKARIEDATLEQVATVTYIGQIAAP